MTPWQAWTANTASINVLCSRIVDGETLTAIARSLGTGVSTLADWIAADPARSARAREARTAAAASYEEQALEAIRAAADPFELAKAKEEAHHLRWKASKANPRAYGDKLALGGDEDSPLTVVIRKLSD
jgi:hypothetical protein